MQVFVSAGEPSGDLHGANLVAAIKRRLPDAEVVGFGGPKMLEAGQKQHFPLTSLAVMWFGRVLLNLGTFFRIARQSEVFFRSKKPAALVVIDYPGFHFALAKRAHRAGVPVYWFVPPQLWAWAGWRSNKMRKWVNTVLSALPFEDDWYRKRGVNSHFIGHPYFDELAHQKLDAAFVAAEKAKPGLVVSLLPGSRNQEVRENFAVMVSAANRIRDAVPGVRFLVASFNEKQAGVAREILAAAGFEADIHVGRTPEIIELADVCLAVSGSVGLEMMYRLKPAVITYKVIPLGWFLARKIFMTCKWVSLVNLLAGEELYTEFFSYRDESAGIADRVIALLKNPAEREELAARLRDVRSRVAIPGATDRAAEYIVAAIAKTPPRVEQAPGKAA